MKYIYHIISLSIISLFISCSTNDYQEFTDTSNTIHLSVEDISTRAGNDHIDDIKNSTKGFGVFVSAEALQASGNLFENHQMKWNSFIWYDQTEMDGGFPMLWGENKSLNVYAYYPYKEFADPTNISILVLQDQSTDVGLKSSDFLSSKNLAISKQNNPINLTFSHQLNKFIFNFPDLNGTIINATIKSKITAKYDLSKQQVKSVSTTNQTIEGYIFNNSVEVINIPQSYSAGHELLTITLQKGDVTSKHIFKLSKELISTQANIFIFNINLNPSSPENILPEPSNILPWGEKNAGDFVATDVYTGHNTLNVSDFTDNLNANGHLGGYYGFVITPTEYLFIGNKRVNIDVLNEQGKSVVTRGGFLGTGSTIDYLKVRGNGGKCQIKFEYSPNPGDGKYIYLDTITVANQTFTLSKTEVFIPNIVIVTAAYNSASKQIIFTTDKPAPMDLIYQMFQWGGNSNRHNEITVTIPTGQSSHSIDISTYDTSKNALVTHDGEKLYSRVNYLKDGNFIVLDGSFWGEDTYLHIPIQ